MNSTIGKGLRALRRLAGADELQETARQGVPFGRRFKANTHIHLPPNFSAFRDTKQAVELAAAQGLSVLGISNYYDFGVYGEFAAECLAAGIFPLFGVEVIALVDELAQRGIKVNDPGNPGKMYICGKGVSRFDRMSGDAQRIIDKIKRSDRTRMKQMIDLLDDVFEASGISIGLDEGAIRDAVARRTGAGRGAVTLQERHVALAFQEAFFARVGEGERAARLGAVFGAAPSDASDAVKVQNDIRTHLMKAGRPAYVEEKFVSVEEASRLVLELGGIPCYPVLADGSSPICAFEEPVERLIGQVKERDIHCVEFIPVRNEPPILERYVLAMREAGLVVTAGTEHNTLDMLPMAPACRGGRPIPEAVEDIFREGACVVVAHEILTLHGKVGFVDGTGAPSGSHGDRERLIGALARMGAAVVERAVAGQGG